MRIEGATVLLTGGSSGIGAALAVVLAERGATVGLVARREDRLQSVTEECRRHAPGSRYWIADLSDLDRAERVALEAWEEWDGVDCLVNNAAIPRRTPVERLTAEVVEHVMDVNYHSPVRMTLALLPRWLERGHGCVVNVSSLGGRIPISHEAAYCASKFALCGWSETIAVDLHGTGVEVKLMLPGPIDTDIWDQPDNDPPGFVGQFVPARECAESIAAGIEDDGFQHYVPPDFPGGGPQHEVVAHKTSDTDAFVQMMGSLSAR